MSAFDPDPASAGIAVIGMSGRFPGAASVAELWAKLRAGESGISRLSDEELLAAGVSEAELRDPRYVKAAGVLGGAETFDAGLFGLTPREAEVMDPQLRVFLECAWEALEDAGHDPERFGGWIGVYAGAAVGKYLWMNVARHPETLAAVGTFQAMISNDKDYLPTQASYRLNLRGPSVGVQTACSTSLVAVHLACQGLISGECDLALAGGVAVSVPERRGYLYQELSITSPDGCCRPFDARAAGTIRSNGAGIVALRRLGDALASGDRVLAVIRGSAINNDGSSKVGFTAPSVGGQAEVIAAAQAVAGVAPETISYVEAHGTATSLGDPIEVAALTQAFGDTAGRRETCALGSLKSNLGHLDAAAGVAGLIKTVLALQHGELPPSLHYETPNPGIDFASGPFYVNTRLRPWPSGATPRRAGVSSFGIGGTNAHVVLEEAPRPAVSAALAASASEPPWPAADAPEPPPAATPAPATQRPGAGEPRPWQLLVLSARSEAALRAAAARLADHLAGNPGGGPAGDPRLGRGGGGDEGRGQAQAGHPGGAGLRPPGGALDQEAAGGGGGDDVPAPGARSMAAPAAPPTPIAAPDLADAAYTLQTGRRALEWRWAAPARSREEACARLAELAGGTAAATAALPHRPAVAFVFPGQGAQYAGMGADLYRREPVFRAAVEECCGLLDPALGGAVRRWIGAGDGDGVEKAAPAPAPGDAPAPAAAGSRSAAAGESGAAATVAGLGDAAMLHQTWLAQPALFVCEHALARLWMSWGVEPAAVLGNSVGEYVAACLAGVLPLAETLRLVALRGRLMQSLPGGAMAAVALGEEEARSCLDRLGAAGGRGVRSQERPGSQGGDRSQGDDRSQDGDHGQGGQGHELSLAAVNGPRQCVVSGSEPAVAALVAEMHARGVAVKRLRTSHAFHSPMMEPILADLRQAVATVAMEEPRLPFVSSLSGRWAGPGEIAGPDHWVRQARQTVRFGDALACLLANPGRVLLEVGPGQGLRPLVQDLAAGRPEPPVVSGLRAAVAGHPGPGGQEQLLRGLAQLWQHGVTVDWKGFHGAARRRRVALPTYPFERRRYYLAGPGEEGEAAAPLPEAGRRPLRDWFYLASWERSLPPPEVAVDAAPEPAGPARRVCLVLADEGGLGEALATLLRRRGWEVVLAAAGSSWQETAPGHLRMRPGAAADHRRLWDRLAEGPGLPRKIVHLWTMDEEPGSAAESSRRADHPPGPARGPGASAFAAGLSPGNLGLAATATGLETALDRSFYSLFHLAQNLARQAMAMPEQSAPTGGARGAAGAGAGGPAGAAGTDVLVFATHLHAVESGDRPQPWKALLAGPCRVMTQELSGVRCRVIDLGSAAGSEPLARCLAEIEAPAAEPEVAWRGPNRWLPAWKPTPLAAASPGAGLRPGGVYLVTGGLGGLGLEIARLLAEGVRARLILLGRTPFLTRPLWDGWLAAHGEDDPTSRRVRRLQALEALGVEILLLSGDVTDAARMAAVRAEALERFGALHGVFHAAGIAGGGLLAARTAAQAAAVLAPKVQGTAVLAEVFAGPAAGLDLLVLFSSLAALTGGIGQADYSAANAFQDSFAAAAALHPAAGAEGAGATRVVAVNWDAWQEVGMAAAADVPEELRAGHAQHLGQAIHPGEGREALARVLAAAAPRIAVSTVSLGRRLEAAARWRLVAALRQGATASERGARARHPRPTAAGAYAAPASPLEARLAELWQELLGIEPAGRDDDFFALGGHSLLAIQLAAAIRARLGVEVPLQSVLSHPTPALLATLLPHPGAEDASAGGVASTAAEGGAKLVALRAHGPLPPLFCVHPAGGNTFAYKPLAEHLGVDQPLYAIQSDGLDGPLIDGLSIETMAAGYVAAVCEVRPHGPYHLAGWSMGGLVAYEMARQLHASGSEVALLALFDTRAFTRLDDVDELPEDDVEILFALFGAELSLSLPQLQALPADRVLPHIVELGKRSGGLAAAFDLDQARRLLAVYKRNRRLMWDYLPRPYPGALTLFQASERRKGESRPLGLGWDGLVGGGLTTHLVPGNHNNLLVEPHVAAVAALLGRLLAAASGIPAADVVASSGIPEADVAAASGIPAADLAAASDVPPAEPATAAAAGHAGAAGDRTGRAAVHG